MKSGISVKVKGFDSLIEKIASSGGDIKSSVSECVIKSAQITEAALKTEMEKSQVPNDLISRMDKAEIEWNGNTCHASVGYKKGDFDKNNLSDGYKIAFLNYGTPNRTQHGQVKARGFIARAKKKAIPQVKKAQQETLDGILEKLKK